MSINNDKSNLDLLEEDDEFEEFPCDDWASQDEDADDVTVWEDNWDDDNVKDDFSQQLRSQMGATKEAPKKV